MLTTKELSEKLKVSLETLLQWRKEGMPYKQLGTKTFRYDLDEVMEWFSKRQRKPRTKKGSGN